MAKLSEIIAALGDVQISTETMEKLNQLGAPIVTINAPSPCLEAKADEVPPVVSNPCSDPPPEPKPDN